MFSNLVQLLAGSTPPAVAQQAFVEAVDVSDREQGNPRVERLILVCWLLIAVKHVAVLWATWHYPVPFNALWINFPTWLLGVLATGLYFRRVYRR